MGVEVMDERNEVSVTGNRSKWWCCCCCCCWGDWISFDCCCCCCCCGCGCVCVCCSNSVLCAASWVLPQYWYPLWHGCSVQPGKRHAPLVMLLLLMSLIGGGTLVIGCVVVEEVVFINVSVTIVGIWSLLVLPRPLLQSVDALSLFILCPFAFGSYCCVCAIDRVCVSSFTQIYNSTSCVVFETMEELFTMSAVGWFRE